MIDHYTVLGVPRDASEALISAAYRALAKAFHPDVFSIDRSFASERLRDIVSAHEVLSDPVMRASYDRSFQRYRERDQGDLGDDHPSSYSDSADQDDWSRVVEFFPELAVHELELAEISAELQNEFRHAILTTRCYADGPKIKERLIVELAVARFGREGKLQAAGLTALRQGRRRFALELNKACQLLGEKEADAILTRLAIKFNEDAEEIYSLCDLRQYLPAPPGRKLELGTYVLGGTIKFRVLPNLLLVFSEQKRELQEYRRFATYDLLLRNYPNIPPFLKRLDNAD